MVSTMTLQVQRSFSYASVYRTDVCGKSQHTLLIQGFQFASRKVGARILDFVATGIFSATRIRACAHFGGDFFFFFFFALEKTKNNNTPQTKIAVKQSNSQPTPFRREGSAGQGWIQRGEGPFLPKFYINTPPEPPPPPF